MCKIKEIFFFSLKIYYIIINIKIIVIKNIQRFYLNFTIVIFEHMCFHLFFLSSSRYIPYCSSTSKLYLFIDKYKNEKKKRESRCNNDE